MTQKRITSFVLLLCMLLSMFNLPVVGAASVDTADTGAQTDVAELGATVSEDTIIYFDASKYPVSGSVIQFMIGHGSWSQGYSMKKVSNSSLYYVKMPYWDGATQYAIFGCNEEWGGENSSVSSRRSWAPWSTSVMSASNLSGTVILTASSSGSLSKSSSSLNTTHTATAYYRNSESDSYTKGTTGGTVSVSGYSVSGSSSSSKSSSTSGSGISSGISTTVTMKASAKSGYIFQGWYSSTSSTSAVSTKTTYTYTNTGSAKTYYARFQMNESYTVTFKDWDGEVLATRAVAHGGSATAPENPTRTGYTFTGWDKSFSNITADTTVTATYSINKYTVTFKDHDGSTLATRTVNYGSAATAPSDPTRSGYEFTGWDKSFSNVTSNLTVTAQYKDIRVWLPGSFNDWDTSATRMTEKSNGTVSVSLKLDPGTYTFKVYTQGIWYGNGGTIEDTTTATSSVGWEMVDGHGDCTLVASGGTYTFTFNKSTRMLVVDYTPTKYTVTFKNWDGTTLSTQSVVIGKAATAPSTPSRPATAQYTYTFSGWDKDFSNVKSNLTVTAQYTSTVRKYTVTFKNWDGTVLATRTVEYGSSATPPSDPEREGDSQYAYTFSGWEGSYTNVTSNTVVTATYTPTTNKYTVIFKDYDGTVLATKTVAHGANAIPPTTPTREGYTFAGWDGSITNITADTTVVATYTVSVYTVTFTDWNGTVLATKTVTHGGSVTAPADPARVGHTFAGWDKTFSNITADTTVTATYTINSYTVTFKDYNGSVLATKTVNYGSAATAPSDPTRAGYKFTGWDKDFSNITANLTVTAKYSEIEVHLLGGFNEWTTSSSSKMTRSSGSIYTKTLTLTEGAYGFKLFSDDVWYGNNGTIEDTTTATSSVGWEMVDTHGDCMLNATGGVYKFTFNLSTRMLVIDYTPTYYTVTFKNWDGTTLSTQSVAIGKAATAPDTPSKAATEQYTYTFSGWDKDFSKVQSDLTVTALYDSAVRKYTVTFKDWDGTVLATRSVEYGSAATAPANPTREGHGFKGWDKTFSNITADTVVTATYTATYYTVKFVDWDGTVLSTQSVAYGTDATPPADPTRESDGDTTYTFSGWDGSYTNIKAYTVITATYSTEAVYHTVTFKDWNGKVLKEQSVLYGSAAEAPAAPTREGYTFAGWDKTFSKVTAAMTVNATYTINSYTVTFKDWNGTTLETKTVNHGSAATAPADPARAGYKFTGWNKDFSNITANLTVTAQYSEIVINLVGDFNGWSTDSSKMTMSSDNVYTTTLNLNADTYKFKIIADGTWYGNDGTIVDTTTATSSVGWEMNETAGDCTLEATGGAYTFTYNASTKMLVVTYKSVTYTVTFKDWDGTILSAQTVTAGKAAEAPTDLTRVGYKFAGWNKDFSKVTSDITVTALYSPIAVNLAGDFNNWSSSTDKMSMTYDNVYEISLHLEAGTYTFKVVADNIWYGNAGVIKNTTIATSSIGWEMSENEDNCTLEASGGIYTFKYNISTNMLEVLCVSDGYVVTFKDWNGTTLGTQTVEAGTAATAPADPTREGHTFAGWDKEFSEITSNLTVNATYTINSYTVTFKDWDGTVLSTELVQYGTSANAPEAPTRDDYVFTGWDTDYSYIKGDTTITAVYEEYVEIDANVYLSGSFNDWSKNTVMTQSGNRVTVTLELEPGTYPFKIISDDVWYGNDGTMEDTTLTTSSIGWEMVEEAGNCTLLAAGGTYTFNFDPSTRMLEVIGDVAYYNVTFLDYDGTVLETQTVKRGSTAKISADPVRERDEQYTYTFTGWDGDVTNIQGDITVTATYTQSLNVYKVTFVNDDGTILKTEEVEHGSSATAPEDPTKEGSELCTFTFAGWDYDFSCITADIVITATYTAEGERYTVTFVDWDGTVLSEQSVVYSTSAIAPEVPVREGDEQYSYVFEGWDVDFSYITEPITVTAVYTLTVNTYTVTFVNYDGSVLKTQLVAYGTPAEAPDTPSRPTTAQFRFAFDGWDTDFSFITGDTVVKATYTASVNGSGGSTGIYNLSREVQRGQILQCWCWSYNNIRANLQDIASQGFSAIQVSPIQPLKESTRNGWNTLMNSSWVVYQPVAFTIETNSFNAQGTKSQFKAMCNEAHKYGIKVIVDAVLNHTANDFGHNSVHPWVPADLKDNPDCWHDISRNISNWGDRYDVTHHCLMSLPDLNTAHPTVQWHAASFLKEAIAAGADGFRFDAAKHIETDWDADGVKSDFWMNVLGEATAYAQSSRGFTPYYYGEVLGSPGGGVGIGAYTRYMSITETGSNNIRNAVVNGNASGAASSGLHTGEGASKAVMYPETHDTYKDDGTRFVSDENINKTWAVIASRSDVCGLYLARPYNPDTTLMGSADKTAWASPAVKAVNQFKNHFVGQSEYLSSYYNLACVERGNSGIVIVNTGGSYYNGMGAPVHRMADGTYKDSITGNIFTVSGGWISGDIGDTGIAVVYKEADKGTFTAGNPTDFALVGTFNDWDASANKFVANDDKSASTVMYLDKGTYNFKLTTDSDLWFSNAGTITDTTGNAPWSMYANVSDDCTLVASGGKYIFTFNSVSGKLSVEYQKNADYTSNMYLKGTFNDWGTDNRMYYTGKNNIVTTTMNLEAGTYSFKLNDTGYNAWYSNPGTINDTTATGGSSGWDMTIYNSDDCTLVATGGTYTFNLNMSTHRLVVLHKPYTYKVVFKDYDGTVITSQTVERGAAAVAPPDPERAFDGTYAYIFAGWDKEFSNITEDTVVTAKYTSAENSYAVIFKDWDGDVISAQLIEVGAAAIAPEDPFREGNAQFTYEFAGWDKEFSNITADTIVTAQYHVTTNQYTVTFKDWDGTLLGTSTVDYGTSAVAPADPTRERTAQYTYVFSNWSEGFSNVTEDIETVAVYEAITNQYTVTFKNWDGTTITTQSVDYGTGAQPPIAPTREGYLFTGWDADYSYITGELTVNAKFEEDIVYLKGDFNNWSTDGAMAPTENDGIVSITLPIEAGRYSFKLHRVYYWYSNGGTIVDTTTTSSDIGWGMSDSEDANCTLVASGGYYTFRFNKYTAYLEILYVPYAYTVDFVDYDGTVLKTEEVERGKSATAPNNPSRDGYAFTGWDVAFDNITKNTTVTATYQKAGENEHIVSFVNWDGTPIAQIIVEDGQSATAPEDPTREGDAQYTYTFNGWDVDISNVTADMTVTATYTQSVNSYTVTFKDWDGTVLSEQVVEYGYSAVAPEAPTREGDEHRTYTFKAWDAEFTSITGDLTVTAQYDVVYTKYTVTFKDFDGTVLSTQQVDYSKAATAPEDPEREGYLFTGWDADFSNISGELTVNATYAEDIVYLRGDFNDWGINDAMTATETDGVVSVVLNLAAGKYTFKINRVNDWYSNAGTIEDTTLATSENGWGMSASESANCTLKASGGYYEFRFNKDTAYLEVLKSDSFHTVTFVNWDASVIEKQVVASGSAAEAPEAPTREGDAQYSYTFNGWDVDFSNVTADMTVTATYTQTVNSYTVTFVDWNGKVLSEQVVEYGSAAEAPEAPTREGDAYTTYTFKGWDVEFTNITADLTVNAVYGVETVTYTVTFKNWDGTVLSTQQVAHGKAAQAPADPEKAGYVFAGWDKDFTNITSDITVTATFAEDTVYLTGSFNEWDKDTVLSATETDNVVSVTMEIPAGNYEFQIIYINQEFGIADAIQDATSETGCVMTAGAGNCTLNVSGGEYTFIFNKETKTLSIEYTPIEFVVIFLDFDGEIISEQMVCLGADAVEPEVPEVEGYTFMGWDGEFTNVESDTPVFAIYEEGVIEYTVTFVDYDGTVLSTQQVRHGKNATAPEAPTREADEQYTYTFANWDKTFTNIKSDTTITAVYDKVVNVYTVTFYYHNENYEQVSVKVDAEYGTAVEAPEVPAHSNGYVFIGWDDSFDFITGNKVITAQYKDDNYYLVGIDYVWWPAEYNRLHTYGDEIISVTLEIGPGEHDILFTHAGKSYTEVNASTINDTTNGEWWSTTTETDGNNNTGFVANGGTYTFYFNTVTEEFKVDYVPAEFTVEFVNYDGTVLSTQTVLSNQAATAPATPNRTDGWEFIGWDKEFAHVTEDMTITAQFCDNNVYLVGDFNNWAKNIILGEYGNVVVSATLTLDPGTYEFKFVYKDNYYTDVNGGTVIDTTGENWWSTISDGGAVNTRLQTTGGRYTFTFATDTGSFAIEHGPYVYTVRFVDWNGTVIKEEEVVNGSAATAPESLERDADAQYTYTFKGWDSDFTNVTGDLTVNAQYETELNKYTVTFTDYDGTELSKQQVEYGKAAWAPEVSYREGYVFTGWDKDITNITGDITVTAQYAEDIVYLPASFSDWSKDVPMTDTETEDVVSITLELDEGMHEFQILYLNKWYGNTGVIEDTTLTTSENGWKMIEGASNCKLNASGGTYTFNFNKATGLLEIVHIPLEYTVTFVDYTGAVLKTEVVVKGKDATPPEAPTREGYMFAGWSVPYTSIKADTVITATYLMLELTYTVTFLDHDGTILKTEIVKTGEDATAPEDPTREGFKFIGWNKDFTNITYNLYVHALYEDQRVFLAGSFTDWLTNTEMTKTETENVYSVEVLLDAGKHHFKVAHKDVWFGNIGEIEDTTLTTSEIGWEMFEGEGDCALIASGGKYTFNFNLETKFLEILYTPVEHTVTFVGFEGEVISEQKVRHGAEATAPEAPAVEGYNFIKWDTEFTYIVADKTVNAVYAAADAEFTVTFVDWNGTVLSTQLVGYGEFAMPPAAPTREGYAFIGWDKNFTEVTGDLVVTATYMATNVYLSGEFNDWSEEAAMAPGESSDIVTYEVTLPKGEYEFKIIAYDVWYGNEGVIEDTTITTSEIGWAMLGYADNCTLKASGGTYTFNFNIYTAMLEVLYTPVEYTVTFVGLEEKEISKQTVKLGDAAEAPEAPEEGGYLFVEWDKDFSCIESDMTVTAKYKKIGSSGSSGSGYAGYDGGMAGTGSIVAKGLDISAWQEDDVNFEAFKAEGYSFVILRCGTSNGKDKYFETYYKQAKAAGLDVGAYYFAYCTTVSGAVSDVNDCLRYISGKTFEYPVYLDFETEAQSNLSDSTASAICLKFLQTLEDNGYLAGMYTGAYMFSDSWVTSSGIRDYYEGWVAHYASTSYDAGYSKYGDRYSTQYGMYQYTDKHYITHNGVTYGPYDANIAYKDYPAIVKAYGFNGITGSSSGDVTPPVEKYTVNFVDYDGTLISTQEVEYGDAATAPKDPTREGYIFTGWDKKFDKITGETTITAQYKDNKVYLAGSFNDWNKRFYLEREGDSSVFSAQIVFLEGTHYFKVVQGDTWYTNASTVIDTTDVTSKTGIELVGDNDLGEIILNASGGTYTFKFDVITNKLIVLYSEEYISYNVTFVDYNGTVLSEQEVYINNEAVAPEAPERPDEGQYSYVFNGWDVDFSRVSSDMTVTATYLQKLATHTVTFVDADGTVLGTSEAEHGFAAIAPEVVPKEGEIFIGWDTDFSSVTSDLTVTAVFISEGAGEASNISIAGTFNDWNSGANYFNKTSNDDIVVVKMELEAGTYEFKVVNDGNWFGSDTTIVNTTAGCVMSNSAGNCKLAASGGTYTFVYYKSTNKLVVSFVSDGGEILIYTVTFVDTDGTVIAKQTVLAGGSATAPSVPEKDGYVFAGWDKDFTQVNEDMTVTANYIVGSYSSVSVAGEFNGWNANANYFIKKSGSSLLTLELTLAKGIYKFKVVDDGNWLGNNGVIVDKNDSGWTMDGAAGDCVLAASGGKYTFQFNPSQKTLRILFDGVSSIDLPTYTVTFVDWNGTVLSTQKVKLGAGATAPANPSRGGGFTFGGWDADFGCVKSDMTINAYYIDNSVYIMGINGNWETGIKMSNSGGSTYKATIKLGAGYYNFKIKHGDNWYGNNGTIEDTTDYTSSTGWGMDPFAGDCTLNAIGSTYTFTFNTSTKMLKITYIAPTYTVTFKNWDGTVLSTQTVKRGDAAKAPTVPAREGSIFIGWDRDYSWIYEDMVITTLYADNNINLMGDFNEWSGTTMTHLHDSIFGANIELASGTYGFKVKIGESWLGNSGTIVDTTTTTSETGWEMSSSVGDNCTLKATGGIYSFAFDVQTKMLIITYLGSGEGLDNVSLMGEFNDWAGTEMTKEEETEESTVYTAMVELEAGTYRFKIKNGLTWFGFNGTIEDTTTTTSETGLQMSVEAGDCTLVATGGLYKFIFDTTTNMLIVVYGDEATGDEATPDEATTDEASPDEAPVHTVTFNESENFTIVTDSDLTAIEDGANLIFTVLVQDGYKLVAVVYNMGILIPIDGVYTIENITSDIPVIVVVEKDEVVPALPKFTVTFTDKDGNELKAETVQYGEAATAPEAPAVEGYEFKGWDTEFDYVTMDITVKATYKKIATPVAPSTTGVIKIEVTGGGTGFTISVDGAAARPQGASYLNTKAPKGAVVTVTANEVPGATFIGWMNPVSGVILTTDYAYTFTSSGNDFFRAMYVVEVEGVQMVTFKNDKANRILDAQYYSASDAIVFPEAPTQVGFDFAGWNMTEAEIKAAIARGEDVTVLATWTKAIVPVQVTVSGGTGSGTYPANNQVTVKANAPEAGQKFAYWVDADGNVKSYNAEYSFFPSSDVELTAVFVAEDAEIEYQILVNLDSIDYESQAATNKAVFTYSWYCPEGYTFVKAGIVAVNKDNFNEATFVAGTTDSNVYDRSPNAANNISVNTYTWTKSSVTSGQTWVARAYVQYRDASGQIQTVYSDIFEATKD